MIIPIKQKRHAPRISLHVPIRYQIRGSSEYANTLSDNISISGLRIVNQKHIPPSTAVMLEIGLASRTLRPIGKIVWSEPFPHSDRNHIGIEFLELGMEEKRYLANFITSVTNNFYKSDQRKGEEPHGS